MTREEQGLQGERKGGEREGGGDVEEQSHPTLLAGTHRVSPIPASPAVPVEAAEDVEPAFLPAVQVQAQDGGEDEQHHGEVEHHNHRSLWVGGTRQSRVWPSLPAPPREGPWPYLEGEGAQGRDGHQGCHEEGDHVADRGESHAGPRALQALPCSLL